MYTTYNYIMVSVTKGSDCVLSLLRSHIISRGTVLVIRDLSAPFTVHGRFRFCVGLMLNCEEIFQVVGAIWQWPFPAPGHTPHPQTHKGWGAGGTLSPIHVLVFTTWTGAFRGLPRRPPCLLWPQGPLVLTVSQYGLPDS